MLLINNRDKIEWTDGMTIRDVLKKMGFTFSLITVTVNGKLVPKDEYDHYKIPDNARVGVFHLAHGG